MTVLFSLSVNFSQGSTSEEMEFDDDTSDEQLDEAYCDWRNNYLDGSWTKL